MINLKPCPFCGAEVQDDERGEKYPRKSPMGGWIIHCECCGASLSQFRKSGKGEISWNTRPIEDVLTARIAELEAAQRWIPVSERLPDTKIVYDKFDVIVEFENIKNGGTTRCVELMSYDYRNKSWNDDCGEYGFYPVAGVTHWRERPTLPEVE